MTEEYRTIAGFENYQISNLGNVRSLGNSKSRKTKILKPGYDHNGYLQVGLYKNRKRKFFSVHRLVAEAFLPNPQNLPQINHVNELKTDNRLENLEWCSVEYNINYGTHNQRVSEANTNHPKKSKPVLQFSKSGEFLREFPSLMEAERKTGIPNPSICRCCHGNSKSAGGFVWRYR